MENNKCLKSPTSNYNEPIHGFFPTKKSDKASSPGADGIHRRRQKVIISANETSRLRTGKSIMFNR